ncbi:MAG TPA: MarR family transcriptional regulator [Desulfobacteria bacterium]|nr:MarR family transcriptional regulator [Desulfobacteria bacterium]
MDRIDDSAEEIKNLFRDIHKSYRSYVASQIGEHNFTVPQLLVLQELYNHPNITLKELSELAGLAKSTVCGIVDRLELQGAVNRVRDTEDRRNVIISLSPRVSELSDTVDIIKKNYLAGLLKKIDQSEVDKIVYGLRVLNALTEEQKEGE